jgi:hypothetical protein
LSSQLERDGEYKIWSEQIGVCGECFELAWHLVEQLLEVFEGAVCGVMWTSN